MKIINPYTEILTPLDGQAILQHIELCGRVCYKSEDKITDTSDTKFVAGIIKRGHEAVLEHFDITVKFVCDRGVSHEIVRHRMASYCQESTRYLGCKEANGSHRKIIDLYNSHKPLARGYAVKYTDAWCSTFASAVAIACGLTDIIPTECGCERHIDLFKKLGSWVENDAYVPSPGDYIFYDWQDGSNYATTNNTGSADHVGIVVSCDGKTIKVIEGNMSDAVGYRKLAVNGRYIRGFGVPKYASKATSAPSGGGEASTPGKDEKPTPGLAVGSVVTFTGTKHYISSMAVNGKSCKPGEAKVTAVAKSGKHPYHLIKTTGSSSTVYGWVDAADVKEVVPAIVKGSKVKVAKGAKTYNGGSLASYVYTTTYTVIQIDGSRVVIGINGVVTAAVNIKDLTLVG